MDTEDEDNGLYVACGIACGLAALQMILKEDEEHDKQEGDNKK